MLSIGGLKNISSRSLSPGATGSDLTLSGNLTFNGTGGIRLANVAGSVISAGTNAILNLDDTIGSRLKYGTLTYVLTDGSVSQLYANGATFSVNTSGQFFATGVLQSQMGTSAAYCSISGAANSNITPVASSGAGTTLISYTLPANALITTGKGVKVTAWGHVTNNANAKTVSLAFGSQTVITKQLTVSIAIEVWKLTAIVVRTGTSTQQIFAEAWNEAGTTVSSVDGPTTLYQATQTSGTQTETATIVIKGVATTATTTDITQDGMIVEYF